MSESHDETWGDTTLRIWSDGLTADEIAEKLGTEPTSVVVKGDPVSSRNPDGPKRNSHGWLYSAEVRNESPQRAFESIVAFIRGSRESLVKVLSESEGDIFIGWFPAEQSSMWIEPADLSMLAALDLPLIFDVYGATSDDPA